MNKQDPKEKRFRIIKPFLNGEKKLKEIETDSGVSYATLKRWVKSYKETGFTGLKKKTRKDKSHHRNLSDQAFDFIKKTYNENPGIKTSNLYKKYSDFIKDIKEDSVSYATIHRIVNNLDNFAQSHADFHLKSLKKEKQSYRLTVIPLLFKVYCPSKKRFAVPFLYMCYDSATTDILNYRISFDSYSLDDALYLLRDTILKSQNSLEAPFTPKEYIIDAFKLKENKKLQLIKEKLHIEIYNSFHKVSEIEKFKSFISDDISKLAKNFEALEDLNSLDKLVFSYIHMYDRPLKTCCNLSLPRGAFEEGLDILMNKTERNIQEYGIRFKNNIYKHPYLKDFVSAKAEIRFDPYDLSCIYIYIKDKYICTPYSPYD